MKIQLSEHFNYRKLLRFAFPSILMMLFTSIYGIVDGFFVSNFAGKTAFAAINYIMPFLIIVGSFGYMLGTGGCALIGKTLGEGHGKLANEIFSMLVYVSVILGIVIGTVSFIFLHPITIWLGAAEDMVDLCVVYGRIILVALPCLMLQYEFQSYCVVAERPNLGLAATVAAGVTNMVLDAVFVGLLRGGVQGAAMATGISQFMGAVIPLVYFVRKNSSTLRLGRPCRRAGLLLRAMGNGASEFVSNISMSVVSMLYNLQLMKYIGENGVAAYGVLMYVSMIFIAIYIGYSVGTAPIVSYHFGAGDKAELKNLLKKSLCINGLFAVCMLLGGELLSTPFSSLYVGYDAELMALTSRAFKIFSVSFPFAALPIYGSSFFTALNDGVTSALISFLRTMVFQIGAVVLLPLIFGADGIWFSLVGADLIASVVAVTFLIIKQKKFGY